MVSAGVLALFGCSYLATQGLVVNVEDDGAFTVLVDGVAWLDGFQPSYVPDVPIRKHNQSTSKGKDAHGTFTATTINWNDPTGQLVLATVVAVYDAGELVHWTQRWLVDVQPAMHFNGSLAAPTGTCILTTDRPLLEGKSVLPATTATALGQFPSFRVGAPNRLPLNWFAPQGNQLAATAFGRFATGSFVAENGQGTMPLLLYNQQLRTLTINPVGHFFVAVHESWTSNHTRLNVGPAASLARIPAGFEYTTAMRAGHGIASSLRTVGDALLNESGKQRADPYRDSFVLSHLGCVARTLVCFVHRPRFCSLRWRFC